MPLLLLLLLLLLLSLLLLLLWLLLRLLLKVAQYNKAIKFSYYNFFFAGMKVKWVCFGDEFKLECPMMNLLLIHLTSVSIPPINSNLCSKRNETSAPCGLVPYSQSLRTECNGRQKCILKKNESELTNAKCKQRFVISVIYECSKFPFTLFLLLGTFSSQDGNASQNVILYDTN